MKIAFYKAEKGNIIDKLINLWTGMYGYSHVELVFSDGSSFSSSPREGCVRFKKIDMNDDKWVFVDLEIDKLVESKMRMQALNFIGRKYDMFGIIFCFIIPINKQSNDKWWCSELISFILKWNDYRIDPNTMAKRFKLPKQKFRLFT